MTTVRRSWIRSNGRHSRVAVEIVHPTYGPLLRGWIRGAGLEDTADTGTAGRTCWAITDFDHSELEPVVGDYVDAEKALLDATQALEARKAPHGLPAEPAAACH